MRFLKRFRERRQIASASATRRRASATRIRYRSAGRWAARVANRRKFRVEVSGNRKWILIGVAVVAVCGAIIYLSVTYGGGIAGLLK